VLVAAVGVVIAWRTYWLPQHPVVARRPPQHYLVELRLPPNIDVDRVRWVPVYLFNRSDVEWFAQPVLSKARVRRLRSHATPWMLGLRPIPVKPFRGVMLFQPFIVSEERRWSEKATSARTKKYRIRLRYELQSGKQVRSRSFSRLVKHPSSVQTLS
jgi:hypothetical protein